MTGRTDPRRRLLVLLLVLVTAGGANIVRLAQWQVGERDRLMGLAQDQLVMRIAQPMQRGTIYDRSGTVALASTVDRDRLVAAPGQLTPDRRAAVGAALVRILGLEAEEAAALLAKMDSDAGYVILRRDLTAVMSDEVRAGLASGELEQVGLETEPVRIYSQSGGARDTTLAAHLMGFVNADGEGQYGVEQRYQDILAGKPRIVVADRDVANRPLSESLVVEDPGVPGADLRLTIDASLQLRVEQEVFAAWVADRAKSVSAIAMDPATGEILAEASYPSYDGNAYGSIAADDPSRFLDPAVSQVFEPGSVFKMALATAALGTGVVTLKTKINDSGSLVLDGGRSKVYDSDHAARGMMTFEDIVAYSRNVGVARVALRLGGTVREASTVLYQTWRQLGFGSKTGIDLAGEVPGLVNDPAVREWREVDLANGAFGQGVAVTPIQLASAYCAMVNGGILVTPHVVGAIGDRDVTQPASQRVMSTALSKQLVGLLEHVVEDVEYYRVKTEIPGYRVGGKTGTAEIWDPKLNGGKGGFKARVFNFSFVGFIGREEPEVVVAVTIREGRPTIYGQGNMELPVQSFELFRRIATDAVAVLNLPPSQTPAQASR